MRIFLLFLLTISLDASAGEHYATAGGAEAAVQAFMRAAHQQPLRPTGENAISVWARDYMQGRVVGFVFSGNTYLSCRTSSTYADGIVTLAPATCRRIRPRVEAVNAMRQLPDFGRSEWDCPMMDGSEVFISRAQAGKLSSVRIGNPGACDDAESRAITAALGKLW